MTLPSLRSTQSDTLLYWLARFGWLSVPMLAALGYAHSTQKESLTRRTLNRLLAQKLVTFTPVDHLRLFTLTPRGRRHVAEQFNYVTTISPKNFGNLRHRTVENWRLIDAVLAGATIFTEHEIYNRSAPFAVFADKMPDGLMETEPGMLVWVEAENAHKSQRERQKIASFCQRFLHTETLTELAKDYFLARVELVCTNQHVLDLLVREFLALYEQNLMTEGQLNLIDIALLTLNPQLRVTTDTRSNLWYDWIEPRAE